MNQRDRKGRTLRPPVVVPVATMEDFLDEKILIPLSNLAGDGYGTYFQLLVGRGSHSQVIMCIFYHRKIDFRYTLKIVQTRIFKN